MVVLDLWFYLLPLSTSDNETPVAVQSKGMFDAIEHLDKYDSVPFMKH